MTGPIKSSYTSEQTAVWIRGLVGLAWADGHFDPEEQAMITGLLHQDLSETEKSKALEPISSDELATNLGHDPAQAENFLRMAVMVALADGDYSAAEDQLLQDYCRALNIKPKALQVLRVALQSLANLQTAEPNAPAVPTLEPDTQDLDPELTRSATLAPGLMPPAESGADVLHPVRDWLDSMDIHDPKVAKMLCKLIPAQCPFERDVTLFGRKLVHIPPMCKLNPLYEQFVGLRFRALSYLADDCGEDVSDYIQ
jgi:tellurite resistance protein